MNRKLLKSDFTAAVEKIKKAPIIHRAPLGYKSEDILLSGITDRICGVSVFNHSGMVKALITNKKGRFLYHGGVDINLETKIIAAILFMSYCSVFKLIK